MLCHTFLNQMLCHTFFKRICFLESKWKGSSSDGTNAKNKPQKSFEQDRDLMPQSSNSQNLGAICILQPLQDAQRIDATPCLFYPTCNRFLYGVDFSLHSDGRRAFRVSYHGCSCHSGPVVKNKRWQRPDTEAATPTSIFLSRCLRNLETPNSEHTRCCTM